MHVKHLLADSIVTAAVAAALVLGGAATTQAQVFPTPTPIGPGSVSKPIYTQPSLPGFHLPAELWTHYGPKSSRARRGRSRCCPPIARKRSVATC